MPPVTLELLSEQKIALGKILEWYKSTTLEFRLGGYAGTGKTTMIKAVIEALKDETIAVSAFTGKAVSVLRKKGIGRAETLHHTMYEVDMSRKEPVYTLVEDLGVDLVIVDEASMISKELYNDLVSFKTKTLWIGDPGQLEPIGDDIKLMENGDYVLNEIHRQAEDSQILNFATDVRLKSDSPFQWRIQNPKLPEVEIIKYLGYCQSKLLSTYDIVLCGYNKTRAGLNNLIRGDRSFSGLICPGEKVVCLKNSITYRIYNGQVLEVVSVGKLSHQDKVIELKLRDDLDRTTVVKALVSQFGQQSTISPYDLRLTARSLGLKELACLDYGYVLTCHKAQGSEWNRVAVVEEIWAEKWNTNRWRYTAITRAAKELLYLAR